MHRSIPIAILVAALCGAFASDSSAEDKNAGQKDRRTIQGTWKVISFAEDGTKLSLAHAVEIVITADTLAIRHASEDPLGGKYNINSAKSPKQIDVVVEEDPGRPIRQLGIYELDGDQLRIKLAAAGKPRPVSFESEAGDVGSLWVLKRDDSANSPRQIVTRAIDAQGGEAAVKKLRAVRITVECKGALIPGQQDVPFTIEDAWQMPDRYKTSTRIQNAGMRLTQTQTIDGDRGWISVNGQVQDVPAAALAEAKEQKYAEDLDRLLVLSQPQYELSSVEPITLDGHPARGVLVRAKGHREVRLYFDSASGLLVKRAQEIFGDAGKRVSQEVVFQDYRETEGLKHWTHIVAWRDGKPYLKGELKRLETPDKIDPREFEKPSPLPGG